MISDQVMDQISSKLKSHIYYIKSYNMITILHLLAKSRVSAYILTYPDIFGRF